MLGVRAAALGLAGLLGACTVTPGPPRGGPSSPPPARASASPTGCPPGVELIGTLVVSADSVYVNNQKSATGRRICDGDVLRTDSTGVGDVLIGGSAGGDSVHLAQNTDPRLRWTAARCILVDQYQRGTVNLSTTRFCALMVTANAQLFHPAGSSRTQYTVTAGNTTEVKPVAGVAPVTLTRMSDAELRTLSAQQLPLRSAPSAVQPQPRSLNIYRSGVFVQPPRRLLPAELRSIELQLQPAVRMTPSLTPVQPPR